MGELTREQQQALARSRARIRAQAAATARKPMSRTQSFLSGVERGLKPIAEFARKFDPLGAVGEKLNAMITPDYKAKKARGEQRLALQAAQARADRPNYYTTGEIGGQIIGTLPFTTLGGAALQGAGAAAKAPALARLGNAFTTGGLTSGRTAAQAAALTLPQRAADVGIRMAGGGLAGATTAALTDQDVSEGAAWGAGLPVIGTVVAKLGGKVVDLVRGNISKLHAASLVRKALGADEDAARAAFAALPEGDRRLAAQALVDLGIEPDAFIAMADDVTKLRPTQRRLAEEARTAAAADRIAPFAGGDTATQTRAAAEAARKDVSTTMAPQREAALSSANLSSQLTATAENMAAAIRQRADEMTASGIVPRMRGLETRSAEQAGLMATRPDVFPADEALARTQDIAASAGARADTGITEQVRLRDRARVLEAAAVDLAAAGTPPLRAAPLVNGILRLAKEPGTRASTLQRRALKKLAAQVGELTDANGMIDARDLYQIRKSELSDIVETLLGARTQPSSGVKEAASGKMLQVRQTIDDLIDPNGTQGWKDFLAQSERGYAAVNRQELAAHALMLAKERPKDFIALMRGDKPEIVEAVMGRGVGKYDIDLLAQENPEMFAALRQSAQDLFAAQRTGELAVGGRQAAADIMGRESPTFLRNLTRMSLSTIPKVSIAAQAAEQAMASQIYPRTRNVLADALLTPRSTLNLMNTYPSADLLHGAAEEVPFTLRAAAAQATRGPLGNYFASDPYNYDDGY